VYAPDDVLLEDVLRQSPDGSARLAAVLGPLEVDTRLIDTLVAFFAHDLDRSRTAAALDLSRGGLGLRLNRIATLTGLDPRTTRGIQVLTAALSARALVGLAGRAPGG
jgi:sugar diacid utilization regulator